MAGQPNLIKLGNDNARGVQEYLEWWLALRRQGIPGGREVDAIMGGNWRRLLTDVLG